MYMNNVHEQWYKHYFSSFPVDNTFLSVQVLTWLEANCQVAVARANQKDPLIAVCREKYV